VREGALPENAPAPRIDPRDDRPRAPQAFLDRGPPPDAECSPAQPDASVDVTSM
jgi:hypothetical protein